MTVAETNDPKPSSSPTPRVAFYNPADGGGTMLDASAGLGEPLNVIISGLSSPEVLTDSGFFKWTKSIQLNQEFLGIHIGTPQTANLGDGNGPLPEIKVRRADYGIPFFGTLIESLIGGNHFRYWRQNGPKANSGALFLAVSHEENVTTHHNIEPDGYDKGRGVMLLLVYMCDERKRFLRDELVARAVGTTRYWCTKYSTKVEMIKGLLPVGAAGINHDIVIDGQVALLTIQIVL